MNTNLTVQPVCWKENGSSECTTKNPVYIFGECLSKFAIRPFVDGCISPIADIFWHTFWSQPQSMSCQDKKAIKSLSENKQTQILDITSKAYSLKELLSSLPKEHGEALREVIAKVAPVEERDSIQFKPLVGGLTGAQVYRCDIGKMKYVFKLFEENRPLDQRLFEIAAHKKGEVLKISPKLVCADQNSLVMVMDYIEGRNLAPSDLSNKELVKKLMQAFKKFHYNPEKIELPKTTMFDRMKERYASSLKKGVVYPSGFDGLFKKFQGEFAKLNPQRVPIHNDLKTRNIMVDTSNNVYLIDWGCAKVDLPFLDIGHISSRTGASNEQIKNMLQEYLGREPLESEMNEVLVCKDATVFYKAISLMAKQDERNQTKLDALLAGPIKSSDEYYKEGVIVTELAATAKKAVDKTLFILSWFKTIFANNRYNLAPLPVK